MSVTITIVDNHVACVHERELDVDTSINHIGFPYEQTLEDAEFIALMYALRLPALENSKLYPIRVYEALQQMRTEGFPENWTGFGIMVCRLDEMLKELDVIVDRAFKREEQIMWIKH